MNAHSLFSKWFSESGKLIGRLFAKIQEVVEDTSSLVFVLIDEVESLTAARSGRSAGMIDWGLSYEADEDVVHDEDGLSCSMEGGNASTPLPRHLPPCWV